MSNATDPPRCPREATLDEVRDDHEWRRRLNTITETRAGHTLRNSSYPNEQMKRCLALADDRTPRWRRLLMWLRLVR